MTAAIPTLSSQYNPSQTEAKWQQFWEDNQTFQADPSQPGEMFSVVIPPPNVTGSLHMGHAFEASLIDTLVRYQRMNGKNTLCLPGTDHASIAVQTILERQLQAEGKTRDDLGREQFLERAWQWKTESGGTIVNQMRRLGFSVDWSRQRFTMDEGLSQAVSAAFVRLYEEGLIYRGRYLVNWCPASQSAVSDLEVENQQVDGKLWHFRYPLARGDGFMEVATTRPETMLGDTAVAVNPQDERYQTLIGQMVLLPLQQREIPIIADDQVDPSFGTGCVKVTPAHDPTDFEIGMRHNLPFINILNPDGTLNENAGVFQGQDRFEARRNLVAAMEDAGLLGKIEDYKHTVPFSDRGKVPVEPLLSTQWFVKIQPLAAVALSALDLRQSPQFVPERWTKVYRDWLINLRDWCISRQLWWGHQIPAWYVVSQTDGKITEATPFVVAHSAAEAQAQAVEQFGADVQLQQDPDVLDTWFSSGLWPFSTLGWPDTNAPDFQRYYPTSALVTGFDIIFFWVARMTMMGGHFTGQMPFKTVYIHGLVRDEKGQKMSKSKNNGIDPLLLIDKYGSDALRYTLIREVAGAGQDISLKFDRKTEESASVEASRNFANKLWNASRFVLMNLDGQTPEQLGLPDPGQLELSDRWVLSRLQHVIGAVRQQLDLYGFGEAAKLIYEFIWGDFCDWYIELVKSRLQSDDRSSRRVAQQTLATVLEATLKLLHPFMPHITEEIWHTLTQQSPQTQVSLAQQIYPRVDDSLIDPALEQDFELLISTIRTVRNLRAEAGIKPGDRIEAILQTQDNREHRIFTAGWFYIKDLAKVKTLSISPPGGAQLQPVASTTLLRSRGSNKAWAEMTWVERLEIDEVLQLIGDFLMVYQRPLLVLGAIGVLALILAILKAVLDTVHQVPALPGFLEIVGLIYSIWYAKRNLWQLSDRQQFWQQIQHLRGEIVGQPRPLNSASTVEVASQAVAPEVGARRGAQPRSQMFAGVVGTTQVLIPLAGLVDVEVLQAKLERELTKVEAEVKTLAARLQNPNFVDKAPPEVVQGVRDTLAEAQVQSQLLRQRLERL